MSGWKALGRSCTTGAATRVRPPLVLAVAVATAAFAAAGLWLAPPAAATNDELFSRQWSLTQIEAARAWTVSRGAGVTIGIVDTGVDAGHPDLAGKVVASADCTSGTCVDGPAQDTSGHGTIVSGIAAAVTGNGRGMAGVAPDASLVVAKVLDGSAEATPARVEAGIHWVVDHGARVVNLSLGDENFLSTSLAGSPLKPAIEWAWSRGAVPVLASGNYNTGVLDVGSQNYGNIDALVVGATDRSGQPAPYSSPVGNAKWGLVAPGGVGKSATGPDTNVISTYPGGGYVTAAGTSMAVPHVSGAVALLLAHGLDASAAVQTLLSGLDRVACGTGCQGRLNMASALGAGPAPAPEPPTSGSGSGSAAVPSATAVARPTTTLRPTATTTTDAAPPAAATTTAAPAPAPTVPDPALTFSPTPGAAPAVGQVQALASPDGGRVRTPMATVAAVVLLFGTSLGLAASVIVRGSLRGGAGP